MIYLPLSILAIEDENDKLFMEHLYIDFHSAMHRVALGVLHHHQDTEDVVSSTCINLCKKVPLLRGMDCNTLRAYILISVRNTAFNLVRERGKKPELLWGESEYLDSLLSSQNQPEDDLFASVDQSKLTEAMMLLPPRERNLIESKYILLHSDQEIAKELNIKPASVRVMLMRTRQRLKDLIGDMNHEE